MKTQAKHLSYTHKFRFINRFYEIEDVLEESDLDTSCPWGCPWDFGPPVMLEGDTVEDMAYNYFVEVRNEMIKETKI